MKDLIWLNDFWTHNDHTCQVGKVQKEISLLASLSSNIQILAEFVKHSDILLFTIKWAIWFI